MQLITVQNRILMIALSMKSLLWLNQHTFPFGTSMITCFPNYVKGKGGDIFPLPTHPFRKALKIENLKLEIYPVTPPCCLLHPTPLTANCQLPLSGKPRTSKKQLNLTNYHSQKKLPNPLTSLPIYAKMLARSIFPPCPAQPGFRVSGVRV
jgi:hypothetical protein